MEKHTEVKISGIKCDTEGCGFSDMDVAFEDYQIWVDSKCPKCNSTLLTQKEYNECLEIYEAAEITNMYTKAELEEIIKNMSPEELDKALDFLNRHNIKPDES